ncbi:hypothetical protein [Erythrobacter donghaensis]|uniref:hypothetical protein n=1 Tax=Erythrobacter donghaensis TaxID=267135 RepID=UPI00117EC886|nr:hypothetical protein [Erythrobacter donghaensis]
MWQLLNQIRLVNRIRLIGRYATEIPSNFAKASHPDLIDDSQLQVRTGLSQVFHKHPGNLGCRLGARKILPWKIGWKHQLNMPTFGFPLPAPFPFEPLHAAASAVFPRDPLHHPSGGQAVDDG